MEGTGGSTDSIQVRPEDLTETQRRILIALCRPCVGDRRYATPATNHAIAAEVFLSVDAVKAHLRALYRKFGVEPLPQNQKRARLVELAIGGGLVPVEEDGTVVAPPPPRPSTAIASRRRALLLLGALLVAGGATVAVLAVTGALSGGTEKGQLIAAEFRRQLDSACDRAVRQLRLFDARRLQSASVADQATAYGNMLGDVQDRLEFLGSPPEGGKALERFENGLGRATALTDRVAANPPVAGSGKEARIVAELTIAAGQVQAGALDYARAPACAGVGDLVARSARAAAAAP